MPRKGSFHVSVIGSGGQQTTVQRCPVLRHPATGKQTGGSVAEWQTTRSLGGIGTASLTCRCTSTQNRGRDRSSSSSSERRHRRQGGGINSEVSSADRSVDAAEVAPECALLLTGDQRRHFVLAQFLEVASCGQRSGEHQRHLERVAAGVVHPEAEVVAQRHRRKRVGLRRCCCWCCECC